MASQTHSKNGMVHVPSKYSVDETIQRLESLVKSRGLMVFGRIDFSGDAAKVGLDMRPTQLLIFGNPKSGTPLMIASPSIALDLPLKAPAWEDAQEKVWLSYNAPEYLKERHGLRTELLKNIAGVGALIESAAG
ncbi:MAG: DUF302 domain-containing protein [Nitrospirales bacterium]